MAFSRSRATRAVRAPQEAPLPPGAAQSDVSALEARLTAINFAKANASTVGGLATRLNALVDRAAG